MTANAGDPNVVADLTATGVPASMAQAAADALAAEKAAVQAGAPPLQTLRLNPAVLAAAFGSPAAGEVSAATSHKREIGAIALGVVAAVGVAGAIAWRVFRG